MFYGSDTHAESAAAIFSIIASCRLHAIDPRQYLDESLRLLPYWPKERYLELAPKHWKATRAKLRADELAAFAGGLHRPGSVMKKPTATGKEPNVVDPEEWAHARAELLDAEKAATRAQDAVAAQRRRLPMVRFRSDYAFATPSGTVSLLDLFGESSQLLLYQFMDTGPKQICPGCRWLTDGIPANGLARLAQAGASWATVSDMPLEQMQRCGSIKWKVVPPSISIDGRL